MYWYDFLVVMVSALMPLLFSCYVLAKKPSEYRELARATLRVSVVLWLALLLLCWGIRCDYI